MSTELIPVHDVQIMAAAFAKSGLFGVKTVEQALSLCLIAQAEGMHPAIAARDYHVIQGRPALKADALLARFQQAGGKVEWHDYTDAKVSATFSHPQGGSVRIDWDMARAKAAELTGKDNWKKYPRQMLRARVISEGIRTVYPGCSVGIYTVEEVQDMSNDKPAPDPIQDAVVIDDKSAGNGHDDAAQKEAEEAAAKKFREDFKDRYNWFASFHIADVALSVLGKYGYTKAVEVPKDKRADILKELDKAKADAQAKISAQDGGAVANAVVDLFETEPVDASAVPPSPQEGEGY